MVQTCQASNELQVEYALIHRDLVVVTLQKLLRQGYSLAPIQSLFQIPKCFLKRAHTPNLPMNPTTAAKMEGV